MSIRLIAADMDGTLLDSRKQLPEGLFPLVRALHERGVRFAPASGRQFYTLYEQFGEIADELMYISENGAMICDGAECVGFSAMPRDVVLDAIERVRTLPGAYTVISARSGAFYEKNSSAEAVRNFNMYCARCTEVPDLAEFASREPICKVALCCAGRAEQVLMPAFADFAGRAQLALSGTDWVDLMRTGVSKGGALEELCGTLGITTADCMAFGDYLNDIELLRTASPMPWRTRTSSSPHSRNTAVRRMTRTAYAARSVRFLICKSEKKEGDHYGDSRNPQAASERERSEQADEYARYHARQGRRCDGRGRADR